MSDEQNTQGELDVLEKVANSPELMDKILETPKVQLLIQQRFFSGPLPPPEMLAQYNQAAPNAADRIIAMAEQEQAHRQQLERSQAENDHTLKTRGQLFGILSLIAILLLAAFLAYLGNAASAVTLTVGTIATIVSIFVLGKRIKPPQDETEE